MILEELHLLSKFKNLDTSKPYNFTSQNRVTVLIGNNGSGKSNLLEAISSAFALMYDPSHEPEFSFNLKYSIGDNKVVVNYNNDNEDLNIFNNGHPITHSERFSLLPFSVISTYSGEELRIWDKYYFKFYDKYVKDIITTRGTIAENQPMIFINKYHWNIALLTMIVSELPINDILNDLEVERIELLFNEKNLFEFTAKNPNEVTGFAMTLFDNRENLTVDKFKEIIFDTHTTLYKKLVVAHLPKEDSYRLIDKLELHFTNGISTKDLSEGEKKQILIKFITRILAESNSLVLFDEPDSQIHIVKKELLKNLLYDEDLKPHVNCVLTTHSPTLTQCFENENVVMLDKGKLVSKDKQEIIEELTHDFWSKQKQNIFLSSNNDILLVEGKFDIIIIEEAVKKINETKYESLKGIEFIPTGGASGLRLFLDKFSPKDNQKVIGILDYDIAGKTEIKEILTVEEQKEIDKNDFVKIEKLKNTYLLKLPKLDRITNDQYEIEDYFPTQKLIEISKKQIDTFKVLKDFTLKKDTVKRKLIEEVESYVKDDFIDFKELLDLIIEIKGS
jgi:ABC-type cobalamin/Fe3+-siderophores transport system ATPase subunit